MKALIFDVDDWLRSSPRVKEDSRVFLIMCGIADTKTFAFYLLGETNVIIAQMLKCDKGHAQGEADTCTYECKRSYLHHGIHTFVAFSPLEHGIPYSVMPCMRLVDLPSAVEDMGLLRTV